MKLTTTLIFLILIFFTAKNTYCQDRKSSHSIPQRDWMQMMQDPDARFRDVQTAFYQWWDTRYRQLEREEEKYRRRMKGEKEEEDGEIEGAGYQIFKRWEYINAPRVQQDGKLPAPDYIKNQFDQYMSANDASNSASGNWTFIGMANYPTNNTAQPTGMGRVNAIAFHPTDPNTIYLGAPSGGIWKTTSPNGNATVWTNLSSNLPTLGVSSILVHPVNPDIIYLGTGDRDSGDAPGIGVYKTTDGGLTWTPMNNGLGNVTVGMMLMHPSDPNTIIAATSGGIFKTTNGGTSWSQKISGNFKDLKFKPGDPNVVYAVRIVTPSEFYRSSDLGETWTKISTIPTSDVGQRMVIGVTPANPQYVYLVQCKANNTFSNLLRSTDSGLNFTAMGVNPPNILASSCDGSGTTTQATYDLCIAVDQNNANTVLVGGVDIWGTTNGGSTWVNKAHWGNPGSCGTAASVHADHHAFEWSPLNGYLYNGNDGGIYYSTTVGTTWSEITGSLPITQIYKIGQGTSNAGYTIFGTQDNGCNGTMNNSTFYTTSGGDGGESIIDYANSNYCYNTYVGGPIRRSSTGPLGSYTTIASNGLNGIDESAAWMIPYLLDKSNHLTLIAGYKNVWRAANATAVPPTFVKISTGETNICNVLEQSSADNNIMYVVREDYWDGTQWITGSVKRSDNVTAAAGSVTWTSITKPGGAYPTDIKAHPTDANIVYATAGNKVYKSADKGVTWTDISVNLPAIPINCLFYDKNTNEGIYIGNQTGVWYKTADMPAWVLFSTGLPPADVRELEIYYDANPVNNKIKAGTYGRGLWQSDLINVNTIDPTNLSAIAAGPTQINLSWSKNAANNDVILAYSSTSTFGTPFDGTSYPAGSTLPDGGTVIYVGNASTFNHTSLSANTKYYYKAWSVNASNQYSNGGITCNATTPCQAVSAPISETFSGVTIPSCWNQSNSSSSSNSWQFGTLTSYGSSNPVLTGNYAYFLSSYGSGISENASLITVPVDLTAISNVTISFSHYFRTSSSYSSTASVAYSTDFGANWNTIKSYTSSTANPEMEVLSVPGAAGNAAVTFRFNYTTTSGAYYWAIDNFEVKNCSGLWTGATSTDWHTATNWCQNQVPSATTDVFIPAGVANMPYITSTTIANCRDITIQTGATLKMAANTELDVKGNWTLNGSYDWTNSASTAKVKFNGSGIQNAGGVAVSTLKRFEVDNPLGITVSNEIRADNIWLTNGIVTTTGAGKLNLFGGSVTRTNGWVNGILQKYTFTNSSVFNVTYEIGDATNYTPVSLSFPAGSITAGGGFSMKTTAGDHPNTGTSTLDGNLSINRYWSFPLIGITFSSCSATLSFVSADADAGTIAGNLIAGKYASAAWTYPAVGTKTSTSVQVTGLASATLGDLQLAETLSAIDWANLQWPSSGTIDQGGTFNVYAQVYEPGVTPGAGQGAGIQCWIGYSSSNTDPSTWTNWVPATFNSDAGNNDEFKADLGVAIPSPGTYYYASRFKRGSSSYVYGGFQGGFWNGTTNVNGTLTINQSQLDWVNLQYPSSGSIPVGGSYAVYAQVYEPGITNTAGQGAGIQCWIGYSTSNSDPSTWTNWVPANYNSDNGNNDEYVGSIGSSLPVGTYYYASRFRLGTSPFVYGGLTGFWSSGNSGVLTIVGITFSGTGNWTDAVRWNTGLVPSNTDNVTIDGSCVVTGSVITANLAINASRDLTISSTGNLTVNGTLINNAGTSGLIVKSGTGNTGSLIHSTLGVNGTFERYFNNTEWGNWIDGWHFLSSPVAGQPISPNFTTEPYDFYSWYEPLNLWVNYKNTTEPPTWATVNGSTDFVAGKGYMVAYDNDGVRSFAGALNVGDVAVSGLTITGSTQANRSWHLLGNPFASALNWDGTAAWNLNNIGGVAKIWNEENQSYSDVTSSPSGIIPATNGFMVQVINGTGSLTLPASGRVHSAQGFYKSSCPGVKLLVKNLEKGNAQESALYFNPEATTGFDLKYDGEFLQGYGPEFYSVAGDLKLSTNTLPEQNPVSFGFAPNEGTSFSITASGMETLSKQLFLKDKLLNLDQNLSKNPVYQFAAVQGDDPQRFELYFAGVGIDENGSHGGVSVYANNGNLVVNNPGKVIIEQVKLTDISGKVILFIQPERNDTSIEKSFRAAPGVYLVIVKTSSGTFAQKLLIR